ncbi:hypothetical protein A5705_02970 [Mycobacterium sp. E787]|nr:hypothetical protein A5705_02970 [Mycobacterium sp. E787]
MFAAHRGGLQSPQFLVAECQRRELSGGVDRGTAAARGAADVRVTRAGQLGLRPLHPALQLAELAQHAAFARVQVVTTRPLSTRQRLIQHPLQSVAALTQKRQLAGQGG